MASARIAVSNRVLSPASSPFLMWVKWRVKPVQSSTSSNSSVILTRGKRLQACCIKMPASGGTELVSGVILRPVSVMTASGSSSAPASRLTVSSCCSRNRRRAWRYWPQSVLISNGNVPVFFSAANFAGGSRYSSKSLNWRDP